MKRIKLILPVLGLLVLSAFTHGPKEQAFQYRHMDNSAFHLGEELSYRVHYGFINAANISIKVAPEFKEVKGRPTYHITAIGNTTSGFDWMYKVRDRYETYLDKESMAPLKYFKHVQENKYRNTDLVYYNHENESLRSLKKDHMDMPRYAQDVISALFYARTLDLENAKPGVTFPIDIYLDQEIYNLQFKYLGKEVVDSDIGDIECFKIRPQLVVDRVFKDEEDMTVWVSADKNKVPVRVQANIWVGSLKVDLKKYKNLRTHLAVK